MVKTSGKCGSDFQTGVFVTLAAAPGSGAVLSGWSGCTEATNDPLLCDVTMDQSRVVSATFIKSPTKFVLQISGGASGHGNVKSAPAGINCTITAGSIGPTGCVRTFPINQTVTLTATAAGGSPLKSWAGAGCDTAGTGVGGASGTCVVRMSQAQSVTVAFDDPVIVPSLGHWDPPITWPAVAVHAHVLPDGRVMTWGRMNRPPVLWDPSSGSFGSTAHPVDFFCSGHAFLPDGRLLTSGGHNGENAQGILSTAIFDYTSNTWSAGTPMSNGRWYPTNTTLASGEILSVSGGDTLKQMNLIPEVYQADGTWRQLSTASLYLPFYPRMFVAPDGRVFAAGPSPATFFLDLTGTGSWSAGPTSSFPNRNYGSAVMYDPGKLLIVGGGHPPQNSAEVIDLNSGAGAAWRTVGSMSVPRGQINATLLANGQVLVTGGTNGANFNAAPTSQAVLAAEVWDPSTEQWTTLARMGHYRLYHSTALLLPDARVLSIGSGEPPATGFGDDYTGEVFSPPYLFNAGGTLATRPTITSAPTQVAYGEAFTIATPNASDVSGVTWIRLGSVTHAFNQSQRMNRLTFSTIDASTLVVNAPPQATLAPPGHYMLFLIDSQGVPSVARIVRIS